MSGQSSVTDIKGGFFVGTAKIRGPFKFCHQILNHVRRGEISARKCVFKHKTPIRLACSEVGNRVHF